MKNGLSQNGVEAQYVHAYDTILAPVSFVPVISHLVQAQSVCPQQL
jgi:hypothetical protein